jgi:beta-galactosidase
MTLPRRDFLRGLTASSAALLWRPGTASAAEIVLPEAVLAPSLSIDTRGHLIPIAPSSLRLGGSRTTARGEESLRLTNYYFERRMRETASGKETIRPTLPVCGEFQFARYNPGLWEDELSKMKACGLTTVATYLFWILHEPEEGRFNWQGRRDLRRFIELCAQQGLEVFLRVGPFVHGEMRNGGLPDWLYGKPFEERSNDPAYLDCVRRFYAEIGSQIRGLLWEEGGPIVSIQLENEFMAASAPWEVTSTHEQPIEWITKGTGGMEHMMSLKKIAIESGLRAPVYVATAWGSPVPPGEFLPMYGGYGFEPWSLDPQTHRQKPSWTYLFRAAHASLLTNGKQTDANNAGQVPFACCELGGGMQCFYRDRFVVPPESVQATAIVSLGSGCSYLGYYVFHGGSNPAGERVFYGEYGVPRISYDFQAPVGENGQIADSYRALRLVHLFLASWGDRLAAMQTILPTEAENLKPENAAAVRWALRTDGNESFLFANNYQDHIALPARKSLRFRIQLDRGEAIVPSAQGLSIAAGESAIYPVGVRLGKLTVAWSTTQLLTEILHEGVRHVFLFAPRGAAAEIALAASSIAECESKGGTVERNRDVWIARSLNGKSFQLRCKSGSETTFLHVLERDKALQLSRHRLWGADRLVLTDADAAERNGQLYLWARKEQTEAFVFPPPQGIAAHDHDVLPGAGRLRASAKPWKSGVSFERIASHKMRIHVAAHALEGIDNLLLRILYVGDVGQLFLHGALVADNYANGSPWEIGLRQLGIGNADVEMLLKVIPREEDTPAYLDETVPGAERFAGKQVAAIESFETVPIYRFHFEKPEDL